MGDKWTRTSLARVSAPPQYGAIAKGGNEYGGPLFIRQTDIVSGRIDWSSVPRCDLEADDVPKYAVQEGDILVSRLGAGVGNAAVVDKSNGAVFAGYLVRFQPNPKVADTRFVGYQLQSRAWRDHVHGFRSGVAQPTLNAQQMGAFEFDLPPLSEQRAIAGILGSLDDKIELNRKMSETLEAISRALFKSWFVDFDPVRAKAEGRTPSGMDAETAKLFPSELVKSALGEIPKGWSVQPLDVLADFRNGLALQKFRPEGKDPRLPVVKIAQLRTGQPDSGEWATSSIAHECVLENGDVVFSWSGSLTVVVWCGGRAALNQHLFRVTSTSYPKWFYLQWLLEHLPEFQRIAGGKATTIGHIQRHHLTEANCVVAERSVIDAADRLLTPLLEQRIALSLESWHLKHIRDSLLPRLLSGELDINAVSP